MKVNELKEANSKLQETSEKADARYKNLRSDLATLQRKHTSSTEALAQKKAQIERSIEIERQHNVQVRDRKDVRKDKGKWSDNILNRSVRSNMALSYDGKYTSTHTINAG